MAGGWLWSGRGSKNPRTRDCPRSPDPWPEPSPSLRAGLSDGRCRRKWFHPPRPRSGPAAIPVFFTTHKVSSDAVHAASKAVLAGTDVECVWENYPFKDLPAAVEKGLLKEEDINKSLMRVLIGRFDLGDFDDDAIVPWAQIPASVLNNEKHRQLALEMARQA